MTRVASAGWLWPSRFTMPDAEAGGRRNRHSTVSSNAPFWYSFEYGSAHFTVISTEHDVRKGSAQREVRFTAQNADPD